MADEKKSYPAISKSNWYGLRQQFKKTMPPSVTTSYVATILNMSEESARANVIGHLKILGIIDETGKPTDRAFRWRDNEQYKEVCEEIRQEIYSDELKSIANDSSADIKQVESWFQRRAKVGENAANKYARVYMLLLEANPEAPVTRENSETGKQPSKKAPVTSRKQAATLPATKEEVPPPAQEEPAPKATSERRSEMPSLHINVQIHISPEASPEQIDQIFESMAKHLRGVS